MRRSWKIKPQLRMADFIRSLASCTRPAGRHGKDETLPQISFHFYFSQRIRARPLIELCQHKILPSANHQIGQIKNRPAKDENNHDKFKNNSKTLLNAPKITQTNRQKTANARERARKNNQKKIIIAETTATKFNGKLKAPAWLAKTNLKNLIIKSPWRRGDF